MKSRRLFLALPVAVLLAFAACLLIPRAYDVPRMGELRGMHQWNLETGSHIAWWLIPAKGLKKPFPVIFLQGGPGGFISGRTIASLAPLADDGYDIYLYDQVGSGHSSRLNDIRDYTVGRHLRELEEIVGKTGAVKVILVGQSWGAILAALFTAAHPGCVEKLILTGPGPFLPMRPILRTVKTPDSLQLRQPAFSNGQAMKEVYTLRWMIIYRFAKTFGIRLASDRESDDFLTVLNNSLNRSVVCDAAKALKAEGGGGYYAQVMTVNSFNDVPDHRAALKDAAVPLLLMRGQCDNQPWGYAAEYLQLFRNHRLVIIPGAGHSISVEQPREYIEAIREFLEEKAR